MLHSGCVQRGLTDGRYFGYGRLWIYGAHLPMRFCLQPPKKGPDRSTSSGRKSITMHDSSVWKTQRWSSHRWLRCLRLVCRGGVGIAAALLIRSHECFERLWRHSVLICSYGHLSSFSRFILAIYLLLFHVLLW